MPIPVEHNPITNDDLRRVFRVLAGTDGHQRTADDVEAWALAARSGRWTRAQIAAATLTLASTFTGFRILPGHMAEQVRADRARIRERWYCPDPPRHLANDPAAELAWRRRAADDYRDRALAALAGGQPLDDVPLLTATEPPVALVDVHDRVERICAELAGRKAIAAAPDRTPEETP